MSVLEYTAVKIHFLVWISGKVILKSKQGSPDYRLLGPSDSVIINNEYLKLQQALMIMSESDFTSDV